MKQYLIPIITFLAAFFTPLAPAMLATGALILMDMVTGIYAAYKMGEKITSRKLSLTIGKMTMYITAIIAAHICETYLLNEIAFVKITCSVIALTEFKSLSENILKATGLNIWKAIKEAIQRKKIEVPPTPPKNEEDII